MDINQIKSELKRISDQSEKNFLALGNLFPSLMSRDGGTSLKELQNAMNGIGSVNDESADLEHDLFTSYGDKYNPLFEQLNKKISDLGELDKLIAGMKENSEQMELIALNAMVISIKSGEKGHAFSRITENLQRLSNDMFLYSDKLLEEEKRLLEFINSLKSIFEGILASQKKLSGIGSTGSSDITALISKVNIPLSEMESNIGSIYPYIQKAMESLQLQDIIRQALGHVDSCLDEILKSGIVTSGSEDELDSVCFKIALYQLGEEVLEDIKSNITSSISSFQTNWDTVTNKLNVVQNKKADFTDRFLDLTKNSSDNISAKLGDLVDAFAGMLEEFNRYQIVQKDLLRTCQNITEKARTMFAVFENLRPVMSRLHHVRILQQIEVSKNDAISSVKDSVIDMDNLINDANASLDTMQILLESFIKETGTLLGTFTSNISKDNSMMLTLKSNKNHFFEELKLTERRISSLISNFNVFPSGFESNCEQVDKNLSEIQTLDSTLKTFIRGMGEARSELERYRDRLFEQRQVTNWQIKNTKFSDLINKFTITAHKEAAGKIGGFDIESGSTAGEITFF